MSSYHIPQLLSSLISIAAVGQCCVSIILYICVNSTNYHKCNYALVKVSCVLVAAIGAHYNQFTCRSYYHRYHHLYVYMNEVKMMFFDRDAVDTIEERHHSTMWSSDAMMTLSDMYVSMTTPFE